MVPDTAFAGMIILSGLVMSVAYCADGREISSAAAHSQPATQSLKAAASQAGMEFGAAVVGRLLADPQSPYAQAVARECSIVTPENDMKFHPLRPTPDTWEWSDADTLVRYAQQHGIKVHGHTLVWHEQLPMWVTGTERSARDGRQLMLDHIEAVVGRWKGKIYAWDVVNEAVEKDGEFRKSYWMNTLGQEYIDLAFRKAHQVDPKALLIYNDFDIEGSGAKADAVYNLIKGMKQRGVPIDAVGLQSHLASGMMPPITKMRATVGRFHSLGIQVWITELDLRITLPATAAKVAQQAEDYGQLFGMSAASGAVKVIQTWGLYDGRSWVPKFFEGYGDALLLDRDLKPKPAYHAAIEQLQRQAGKK